MKKHYTPKQKAQIALEILKEKGFERDQIHCEVYF